jgi:WD40 repeat protein
LWEADTGKQRTMVVGHSNTVYCVAFAPAGDKLASASFDRTIKLWDLEKSS